MKPHRLGNGFCAVFAFWRMRGDPYGLLKGDFGGRLVFALKISDRETRWNYNIKIV
jgi:hypothetical protein